MKEQYVGDVNDYRKYALLRLLGRSGLKLGVCWMLTPDDGRTDGNKLRYLDQATHQRHDPELFALLRRVKDEPDARRLILIESSDLLHNAVFDNSIVDDQLAARQLWFRQAMHMLADCDLVFFDPDNGLDVVSKAKGTKNSSKFLYRDEVATTYAAGHSVLIYQHFPREERTSFITRIAKGLRPSAANAEIWAFRTPHVVFMLLIQPRHRADLTTAAQAVLDTVDPKFLNAHLIEHMTA